MTGTLALSLLVAGPAHAQPAEVAPAEVAPAAVAPAAVAPAAVAPAAVAPAAAPEAAPAAAPASKAVSAAARAQARMKARAAYQRQVRNKVVRIALRKVGHSRYVAGAAGPNRFDCSGLALYVWRKAAGKYLPHYSRAQAAVTRNVSRRHLQKGDLVFFFRYGTHHVGIYIGRGRMVSAANPRSGITIDRVFSGWYGQRYSGAGRLF